MKQPAKRRATTGPDLGRVLEFMRLLWAVNHVLATTSKHMAARYGITGPQRLVVRLVGRFPWISAGTLARILHLHPSTLTAILIRLESKRILTRRPDPRDRRRVRVRLTPAGRRLAQPAFGAVERAVMLALTGLADQKIEITREVLTNIVTRLEASSRPRRHRRQRVKS